jgi:hypothetical protein
MKFGCFSCGRPMAMTELTTGWLGWCARCQVAEVRDPAPYLCRTTSITSEIFSGVETFYMDHGSGHYPSPA